MQLRKQRRAAIWVTSGGHVPIPHWTPKRLLGLAKPLYEEVATLLESKNDPHYNSALIECYSYLGYYYLLAIENPALKAEAMANKEKSKEYWSKILAIDSTNATAKRALDGIK